MCVSELEKKLLADGEFPARLLPGILTRVKAFAPETKALLDAWLAAGTVGAFELHGLTSQWLRAHRGMKDIGLILSHDWLLKEGEAAAAYLRMPLR
ncbi:MAG: hypothetical protein LBD95_05530 [Clostridiales Family XIII bacterium]|jgi:hypothetical protein|nr:hypothetical protein [Clostridiales Family XIII bacterium]